jgi:transcriptional regulator with XRE-family HTH domain
MPERGNQAPFRDALPRLLSERGLSLRELGRRLGLDATYLSRVLRGQKRVSGDLAERVARALELPVDYFPEAREHIILEAIRREPEVRELVYDAIRRRQSTRSRRGG